MEQGTEARPQRRSNGAGSAGGPYNAFYHRRPLTVYPQLTGLDQNSTMAAPGFGFSVGDFISGIQLTGQVIDALRTSNTAPAEYKCALTLLQTLHCLLQQFVDTPIAGNEESQARAVACAKEAITCVQRFATRIGRLEHALGLPHEATRLTLKKRVARVPSKLKWALCTKDDLASFTNTVMPHVSMVQLYLQMQQCSPRNVPQARMTIPTETSAAIETHQRRLEQDLEDVGIDNDISRKSPVLCARAINSHRGPIATASFGSPVGRIIVAIQVDGKGVRELVATIGTIMNLMWSLFAKLLGASSSVPARPTTSLDTDIVVTDALGRVIRLPYEHFQISWMMVYARLSVAFEDCPGELKVQEGSYVMRCGHREPGDELDADNWNTVSPGAKLSMVLVIESGDYSPTECPACGLDYEAFLSTDDGEQFMRKWITW